MKTATENTTLDLAEQPKAAIAPTSTGDVSIAQLIDKLASTPNLTLESVAIVERLVALQERQDAQRRKEGFEAALLRVQRQAPRILQNGVMVRRTRDGRDGGTIKFATREDIDAVMRPIYQPEGFTVTWDGPTLPSGKIDVIGRFTCHGHTEERHWVCGADDSGGKTPPQATSSTIAYGKRQVSKMMWDIIEEGKDNNGARAEDVEPITQDQADAINTMLADINAGVGTTLREKFKRTFAVEQIEDLKVGQLSDVYKRIAEVRDVIEQKKAAKK